MDLLAAAGSLKASASAALNGIMSLFHGCSRGGPPAGGEWFARPLEAAVMAALEKGLGFRDWGFGSKV